MEGNRNEETEVVMNIEAVEKVTEEPKDEAETTRDRKLTIAAYILGALVLLGMTLAVGSAIWRDPDPEVVPQTENYAIELEPSLLHDKLESGTYMQVYDHRQIIAYVYIDEETDNMFVDFDCFHTNMYDAIRSVDHTRYHYDLDVVEGSVAVGDGIYALISEEGFIYFSITDTGNSPLLPEMKLCRFMSYIDI